MVEVPITKAPIGDISGTSTVTRHGRDIFGYKGIPYEQPTNWKIEVQKASKHGKASTYKKLEMWLKKCVQLKSQSRRW